MTLRSNPLRASLFLSLLAATGCEPDTRTTPTAKMPAQTSGTAQDAEPLSIVASVEPLGWMCRTIGGEAVKVNVMTPSTADPAAWRPPRPALIAARDADLLVVIGEGFEPWRGALAVRSGRVLTVTDRSAGVAIDWIETESATHSHGPGGEHSHGERDGYVWMDPQQAKDVAAAIAQTLVDRRPSLSAQFARGLQEVHTDLDRMDAAIETLRDELERTRTTVTSLDDTHRYLLRRLQHDSAGDHVIALISDPGVDAPADAIVVDATPDSNAPWGQAMLDSLAAISQRCAAGE